MTSTVSTIPSVGVASTEDEPLPITIEPMNGEIPPGQEQIISVKVSPLELMEVKHTFRCK